MPHLNQLTKKNHDFINIATKQLMQDGKSDSEIKAILEDILPTILEHQRKGETARHFLGAPTAWAASFSQPAQTQAAKLPEKNTDPRLMWMDMTLFLLGAVALLNALTGTISKTSLPTKLVSLLVLAMLGGVALYLNYHYIYRHMGKDRSQRPPIWKSLLILSASMAIWVLVSAGTTFLPDRINPTLSVPVLLVIGAVALATRFYLKARLNIQDALVSVRR